MFKTAIVIIIGITWLLRLQLFGQYRKRTQRTKNKTLPQRVVVDEEDESNQQNIA